MKRSESWPPSVLVSIDDGGFVLKECGFCEVQCHFCLCVNDGNNPRVVVESLVSE